MKRQVRLEAAWGYGRRIRRWWMGLVVGRKRKATGGSWSVKQTVVFQPRDKCESDADEYESQEKSRHHPLPKQFEFAQHVQFSSAGLPLPK